MPHAPCLVKRIAAKGIGPATSVASSTGITSAKWIGAATSIASAKRIGPATGIATAKRIGPATATGFSAAKWVGAKWIGPGSRFTATKRVGIAGSFSAACFSAAKQILALICGNLRLFAFLALFLDHVIERFFDLRFVQALNKAVLGAEVDPVRDVVDDTLRHL